MIKILALLFLPSIASANPYFRTPRDWALGTASPQTNVGACIGLRGESTEQCTEVGVVTHSPNDSFILVPGEDWSALSIGYALVGVSKINLIVGPSLNVLPILVWAGSAVGLPITIPSISAKGISLTGSVGPKWEIDPVAGKGYFKIMTSGTLRFGGTK